MERKKNLGKLFKKLGKKTIIKIIHEPIFLIEPSKVNWSFCGRIISINKEHYKHMKDLNSLIKEENGEIYWNFWCRKNLEDKDNTLDFNEGDRLIVKKMEYGKFDYEIINQEKKRKEKIIRKFKEKINELLEEIDKIKKICEKNFENIKIEHEEIMDEDTPKETFKKYSENDNSCKNYKEYLSNEGIIIDRYSINCPNCNIKCLFFGHHPKKDISSKYYSIGCLGGIYKIFCKECDSKLHTKMHLDNKCGFSASCNSPFWYIRRRIINMIRKEYGLLPVEQRTSSDTEKHLAKIIGEIYPNEEISLNNREVLNGLELDIYIKRLKLAFEYNGIQHYKYNKFFHHNDIEVFFKMQDRDKRKAKLCKTKKIKLIIFNYKDKISKKDVIKKMREWENCKKINKKAKKN